LQVEEVGCGNKFWDTTFFLKATRVWKQLRDLRTLQLLEPPRGTLKARRAALQGLVDLQHLRSLGVMVWDDHELAIIAELSGLRDLHLVVAQKCTKAGVLQLEKLRKEGQLQAVSVWRYDATISVREWKQISKRLPIDWKISFV
jgi:hypothetical protein